MDKLKTALAIAWSEIGFCYEWIISKIERYPQTVFWLVVLYLVLRR